MAIGRSGDIETFTACLELFDALCVGSRSPEDTAVVIHLPVGQAICVRDAGQDAAGVAGGNESTTRSAAGPATGSPKRSTISSRTRSAKPTATAAGPASAV